MTATLMVEVIMERSQGPKVDVDDVIVDLTDEIEAMSFWVEETEFTVVSASVVSGTLANV